MTLCLVALIRTDPRPGLVLLDANASAVSTVAEGSILRCAWAPGAPVLAYQREDELCIRHPQGNTETLLSALPVPVRRTFAFNPQGDGIAVLADGALFLLPVLDSFGSGRRLPMPGHGGPIDVQWFGGGGAIAVGVANGDHRSLLQFDLTTNGLRELPIGCDLIGARRSDDRLVVRRIDPRSGEDEACVVDDDGSLISLFSVPEGYFISTYLPGVDLFLVAESSEDGGDPTTLQLVMPGGMPGERWLAEFPNLTDWAFSPDGSFLTGMSRSHPEDPGELVVAPLEGGAPIRIDLAALSEENEQYQSPAPADPNHGAAAR